MSPAVPQRSLVGGGGAPYLFFRCWTLPRHLNLPFTMMAILVHKASHSSMLTHTRTHTHTHTHTHTRWACFPQRGQGGYKHTALWNT